MNKLLNTIPLFLTVFAVLSCGAKDNPSEGGETLPQAPGAPAALSLHSFDETSLTFQWTAVSGADSYSWTLSQAGTEVKSGTVKGRNVKVEGLTKATDYRFGVKAVNAGGESAYTFLDARTAGEATPGPGPVPTGIEYEDFAIPAAEEDGVARAFPGAEGGGMYTTGGRGGKVIHVTNLNDKGTGSLRAAIETSGARTIVFDVAGTIELASDLKITKGDVTIAGQTAPGDGICIKNYATNINADNVIIRFVRFRLGDEGNWSEADINNHKADGEDCIWGRYHKDIILDHCSMSWSIDETASFYANANMTLQWSIIAESMKKCRLHSKGDHGYGGIWGGKDASFHHNLLASHSNRTPRFDHTYLYEGNGKSTATYRGNVDYRNCVNYNGQGNGCYGGEGGNFNMVNNYYKNTGKKYFIEADGGYVTGGTQYAYDWAHLYLSGNYNSDGSSDKYPDGVYWKKAYDAYSLSYDGHVLSSALPIHGKDGADAYVSTHTASGAYSAVCSYAGASLRRDAVDKRIVTGVKNGTGRIINDIADIKAEYGSAWPALSATDAEKAAVADADGDGIPDAIETAWGLDKNNAQDGAAKSLDKNGRYTNLEMYLHYLVREVVSAQNQNATYNKL
ncbi:MAG: fibronectin type III domain-containing protein [Bacteroidales bacterium]|nr:fibronectin type III domain-containing protein [Bacteroidales bacterium]